MQPRVKLKDKEIRAKLETTEAKTKELIEDNRSIKSNHVIQNFLAMKKDDILALTATQKNLLIFRLLRALCWSSLDDE